MALPFLAPPALIAATLFTGAAGYISLVEHPARLTLADAPMLDQWRESYARALPIQSILAIVAGVAALAVAWETGDWRWIAGGMAMLANWPFTIVALFPINRRLQAVPPGGGDGQGRRVLQRWGRLHHIRSLLGLVAVALFLWAFLHAMPLP